MTTLEIHMLPDPRLRLRAITLDDAPAILELVNTVDGHDFGLADLELADVLEELGTVDLERDAWMVTDGETPVATASLSGHHRVTYDIHLHVLPEWRRRGIGSMLLDRLEAGATAHLPEAPPDARVAIRGWTKGGWEPGLRFGARHGYAVARRYLRMQIVMTDVPPAPAWPEGITVRAFRPGEDDVATHAAAQDAFADHWGFLPTPFEEWRRRIDRDDFDASLWSLALDDGEIAGTSLSGRIPRSGWIGSLSVRRPWRRRGLARALLLHSFGQFWERGERTVGLGVDAGSLTGATRLYESVAMSVAESYDQLEREIRPGRDLAVRSLG